MFSASKERGLVAYTIDVEEFVDMSLFVALQLDGNLTSTDSVPRRALSFHFAFPQDMQRKFIFTLTQFSLHVQFARCVLCVNLTSLTWLGLQSTVLESPESWLYRQKPFRKVSFLLLL